jgi:hypothetical protein
MMDCFKIIKIHIRVDLKYKIKQRDQLTNLKDIEL